MCNSASPRPDPEPRRDRQGLYVSREGDREAVLQARASATQAQINVNGDPTKGADMQKLAAAEGQLTGMGRLMAVAEAYPDLKANQNMMQLSEELAREQGRLLTTGIQRLVQSVQRL